MVYYSAPAGRMSSLQPLVAPQTRVDVFTRMHVLFEVIYFISKTNVVHIDTESGLLLAVTMQCS